MIQRATECSRPGSDVEGPTDVEARRPWEEARVPRRAAEDDRQARDRVVAANMPLVVSIARRFTGSRLDFEDLVQEGVVGLLIAIERFRPELGFRLSTYATYWIRQAITRAIDNHGRMIRLPVNLAYAAMRVERVARELAERLGREPTTEEIAGEARVPERRVSRLLTTPKEPLSLDVVVSDEDGEVVGFHVADEEHPSPEETLIRDIERDAVRGLLDALPERERRVLWQRMGFEDGRIRTLREVAEQLHVSREAVRRIEFAALRRLRSVAPPWIAA
jgi:RNA polymerase primary sigma factor